MKEHMQLKLVEVIKAIAKEAGIEAEDFQYTDRKVVLEQISTKDGNKARALEKLINDLEAYFFTRADKEIRLKAPDILKMELERIGRDVRDSQERLKGLSCEAETVNLINDIEL